MRKVLLFATLIVLVLLLASCMKPAFAVLNLEANNTTLTAGAEVELSWELNTPEELVSVDYVLHIDDITIEPTETSYATVLASGDHDVYVEATYVTKSKLGFTKKPAIVESDHLLIKVSLPAGELSINVPETVQSGDPVDVNWTLSIPASYESVTYEVYVDGEIAETTTETKYSTVLEEGQHDIYVKASVAFANGEEIEITSETKTVSVVANTVVFLTETTEYGPGAVTIEWEPTDGLTHTYQYSLSGGEIIETTATSVTFEDLPDGTYTLSVKPAETTGYPSEFTFSVDLTGPSLVIVGSDRNLQYLTFGNVGDAQPYGRYAHISWYPNEQLSAAYVRFYRFEVTTDESGNATNTRVRLNLKDEDEDGVYDSWEEVLDPDDQYWYPWDPEDNDIWVNDELMTFDFAGGPARGENLFKLGEVYAMYFLVFDKFGNQGWGYVTFKLDERYDSDSKPEIYYHVESVTAPSTDSSGVMTVSIVAPNVKDYIEQNEHDGYDPDTTFNDDLMYLQVSLVYDAYGFGMTVADVDLPNYMEGKTDLSSWKDDGESVTIYRGFVDGPDEAGAAGDVLATITLEIPPELAGSVIPMGLDNTWYVRDTANRTIDGIVLDTWLHGELIPAAGEM